MSGTLLENFTSIFMSELYNSMRWVGTVMISSLTDSSYRASSDPTLQIAELKDIKELDLLILLLVFVC